MTKTTRTAALSLAVLLFIGLAITHVRAEPPVPKQYLIQCTMTKQKDGKSVKEAEPQLIVASGVEGSFLAGGEIKTDDTPDAEKIPFGVGLKAKVTAADADHIKVVARFSRSNLDTRGEGTVINETAVQMVRKVKLDEPLMMTLENGSTLKMTISEVTPARAGAK